MSNYCNPEEVKHQKELRERYAGLALHALLLRETSFTVKEIIRLSCHFADELTKKISKED